MTVEWEGRERPLPQLRHSSRARPGGPGAGLPRARRRRTSNARPELAALFDRMYGLRQQAARNAGFGNFRDYIFPAKLRFDYTPADCERFHEAVERHVMPAV